MIVASLMMGCSSQHSAHPDEPEMPPDVPELNVSVPTGGNSWCLDMPDETSRMVGQEGVSNWTSSDIKLRTYFKTNKLGKIGIGLRAKVTSGKSLLKVTFNGVSKELSLSNQAYTNVVAGLFEVTEPGYQFVQIEGIDKEGASFAEISDVLLGGEATSDKLTYVKDEDFYWARRNPAINISYIKPENVSNALYFYNEVTVPEGFDAVGSYFMSSGFSDGYFGFQVNEPTRRQILFSVWSDYKTNDPNQIPEEYKITELKHGSGVTVGTFGNEGSGAQSKRIYNWQAGQTYKFLIKAQPSANNSTDFTAWFFAPEIGKWELIASFRKPKKAIYLENLHSFMENFKGNLGNVTRKGLWSNQWYYDATTNSWVESTKAKFGVSPLTARGERADYSAGSSGSGYLMRINGFFNDGTGIALPKDAPLERASGTQPDINFSTLP